MKRIGLLFPLLVICFVALAQAQTTAPKPSPEMRKLHRFVGHWVFETEYKPTPLGPVVKTSGEFRVRMALKGFFAQCDGLEKSAEGETHFVEIWGYDPVEKNYFTTRYSDDDGSTYSETFRIHGSTVPVTGALMAGGKRYLTRRTEVWSADGATMNADLSIDDGKTWIPWFETKVTKATSSKK